MVVAVTASVGTREPRVCVVIGRTKGQQILLKEVWFWKRFYLRRVPNRLLILEDSVKRIQNFFLKKIFLFISFCSSVWLNLLPFPLFSEWSLRAAGKLAACCVDPRANGSHTAGVTWSHIWPVGWFLPTVFVFFSVFCRNSLSWKTQNGDSTV